MTIENLICLWEIDPVSALDNFNKLTLSQQATVLAELRRISIGCPKFKVLFNTLTV